MTAARMLNTARRRAGMTQRALAQATGIPQASIARIERGLTRPRVDTMQRLLHATGQDLEVEERLGRGIDRTGIRELLALSPEERIDRGVRAARSLANFVAQVRGELVR